MSARRKTKKPLEHYRNEHSRPNQSGFPDGTQSASPLLSSVFAGLSSSCSQKPYQLAAIGAAILFCLVFFVYTPSLSGDFLLDDDLITENPITHSSDGLSRIWCSAESADYWPITNSLFWIQWQTWGNIPTGYHVVNVFFHIADCLLLWLVLRKLRIPGAFFASLLFAVHPVNVESVAWIIQLKNTSSLFFFLLSLYWFLPAEQTISALPASWGSPRSFAWLAASFFAFVLAMLCKGSVAILPLVLLGIIAWNRKIVWKDLVRIAPFFIVAAGLTLLNIWFQSHIEDISRKLGLLDRCLGAGAALWFYVYTAFYPVNLSFIYPLWKIDAGQFLWWIPAVAALLATASLWHFRNSRVRPVFFAWLFFCTALLPALGFVDVGYMRFSPVADHYQHIALIGIVVLIGWLWSIAAKYPSGAVQNASIVAAVLIVGVSGWLCRTQNELYRSPEVLYWDVIHKNPGCWLAYNNVGTWLEAQGRPFDAITCFQRAIERDPTYMKAYYNLGTTLMRVQRYQEAIDNFKTASELAPNDYQNRFNYGDTLVAMKLFDEGVQQYLEALRIVPNDFLTLNHLGLALAQQKKYTEAIERFTQAANIAPKHAGVHNNLGNAYLGMERFPEAIACFEKAIALQPDYVDVYINLGVAHQKAKDFPKAIDAFQRAVQCNPKFADAHMRLAICYDAAGMKQEAIAAAHNAKEAATQAGNGPLALEIEQWIAARASQ